MSWGWGMSEFPENWTQVLLSEIAEIEMGQSPDSRSYNDEGIGIPFFQGKAEFGKLYPTVRKWCTVPKKIAEEGDILLSVRAPVGPTNLAAEMCCVGRGLAAIRAETPINQKYLLHYFRSIEPWLSQQGTGTTFTAIGGAFIRNLDVPLAPLPEQKRIADKLDALLGRVDTCQAHLARVPEILKRFRQSVLAAATSGRLTEGWRNEVKKNWGTHKLEELCSRVSVGHVGTTSKYYTSADEGIPFLRSQNIRPGKVDLSGLVYITRDFHNHLKKSQLQAGDLLIVRVGANRGDTCVLPSGFTEINCANIVFARPTKIFPAYLGLFFQSPSTQEEMLGKTVGGAQGVINTGVIGKIYVDVPPLEEQHEIVRRVERLFAFADRLEVRWQVAQARVGQLTPSLLAKAFRGELVEQREGEESAGRLVERGREGRR